MELWDSAESLGLKTFKKKAKYMIFDDHVPLYEIAGIPAISVPGGFVDGLPVGLQFMAGALKENNLFRVAYAYEQATDWHTKTPSL